MARKKKNRPDYPNKYNEDIIPTVFKNLTKQGKTLTEIAKTFGIHISTLHRWCEREPTLRDSIIEARAAVDDKVEEAFLKRCLGMKVKEKREVVTPQGGIEELNSEKEIPPDPGSIMKWLGARRPNKWGENTTTPLNEVVLEMPDGGL